MRICYDKARGYKGGGIIIPKDKFKEFVSFKRVGGNKR